MPDTTFELITKFIESPPGQFAAGAALGGIVIKFFKSVGDVLNDKTNKEIARWIKVRNVEAAVVAEEAVSWPETFARVFDRVFGEKHLSWRCFWRSCVASTVTYLLVTTALNFLLHQNMGLVSIVSVPVLVLLIGLIPIDYVSLLETRAILMAMCRNARPSVWALLMFIDCILSISLAAILTLVWATLSNAMMDVTAMGVSMTDTSFWTLLPHVYSLRLESVLSHWSQNLTPSLVGPPGSDRAGTPVIPANISNYAAALLTSIWIWLYAAAGFTLKAARRFDIGFQWFNAKFDVDKKPLQSIGIVAGAMIAVLYWAVAAMAYVWH